jgi:hypothetical protein
LHVSGGVPQVFVDETLRVFHWQGERRDGSLPKKEGPILIITAAETDEDLSGRERDRQRKGGKNSQKRRCPSAIRHQNSE